MSGIGRIPEPTGRACQQRPLGREGQDHVLDVGRDDERGQPLGRRERVVQPHREVAGVEGHPGDLRIEAIEQGQHLVGGQVGVRLDGQAESRSSLSRGVRLADDLQRRRDLGVPGRVGPEAVVAVADVRPGVAAPQRRERLDVRRQVLGHLAGPRPAAPSSRERRTGFGDGMPGLEIEAQLRRPAGRNSRQGLGIERIIDRGGVQELDAVEAMGPGEPQGRLGRELAVARWCIDRSQSAPSSPAPRPESGAALASVPANRRRGARPPARDGPCESQTPLSIIASGSRSPRRSADVRGRTGEHPASPPEFDRDRPPRQSPAATATPPLAGTAAHPASAGCPPTDRAAPTRAPPCRLAREKTGSGLTTPRQSSYFDGRLTPIDDERVIEEA